MAISTKANEVWVVKRDGDLKLFHCMIDALNYATTLGFSLDCAKDDDNWYELKGGWDSSSNISCYAYSIK